jgi:hypothetical protein
MSDMTIDELRKLAEAVLEGAASKRIVWANEVTRELAQAVLRLLGPIDDGLEPWERDQRAGGNMLPPLAENQED